jgi:hypothetical protein
LHGTKEGLKKGRAPSSERVEPKAQSKNCENQSCVCNEGQFGHGESLHGGQC